MSDRHQRMTELFGRALSLDEAARAALLDEIAHDDRELAAEVRSLLAVDAGADRVLRTGGLADATAPAIGTDPHALAIPGFRIDGVLGEGAMGVVLAAEQLAPRRPVAIKVLRARHPVVLARFTAEAEIMARLDHPGIARIHAAGEADGAPYLVMERVVGVTLDQHVRGARPSIAARLALFAQVCDAIHHAHVKGVVHRDLKPSNVMVRDDGRAAVLDFGIARLLDGDRGATREGELIGTPVYMSPEQAALRPDQVDTRSDVYALGVILYELLSGELPYDVRGRSFPAMVRAICETEPRPLGAHDRALRGDLDAIARRALAKAPADRYPSAAALADDVRRFLDRRSVSARTPGAVEQVWRSARRHPGIAIAIAAALIGAASATAVITSLWLDARASHRAAVGSRDALELRANELTLSRAQLALARDPASALADLATLTPRGVDPWQVALIADHARGLGGASRVLRAARAETRWAERSGDTIVSASYDGVVRAWRDGADAPRILWRAEGRAHLARLSPDGTRVAIGADGGQAAIVDLRTGAVRRLVGHAHDVERIAWSPDGRWLISADDHGGAHVWWDGGDAPLAGPTASVQALGICGPACAFAGDDRGRVTVWALGTTPRVAATVDGDGSPILGAWAGPDAIAAASEDGTVIAWRRDADGFGRSLVVETGAPIHDAAFAPDGAFAVLGRVDGSVVQIEGRRVVELGRLADLVRTVAVSSDGAWMAAGGDGGELVLWSRNGRRLELRGHAARIRHLAFDRAGLVSSDGDGVVRTWQLAAIPPTVWLGRGVPIDHVISGDGAAIAAIAIDIGGEIRALAPDGGVRVIGEHGHRVRAVARLRDRVVTASGSDVVSWRLDGEPDVADPPVRVHLDTAVTALAASPDGVHVAVATRGGAIALLDADGAIVATAGGDDGGTDAIAFDPSGTLLASAGQDRVVRVWRVGAGAMRAVAALPGPTGDTHHVAFAPDGAHLFAGGDDGAVRAWTVRGGSVGATSMHVIARHTGGVVALAVSTSGRALATTGRDGRVVRIALDREARAERDLASTPIAIAVDDDRAAVIDSDGALWRWLRDDQAPFHAIPIDATALSSLRDGRALVGLRDGEVIQVDLR